MVSGWRWEYGDGREFLKSSSRSIRPRLMMLKATPSGSGLHSSTATNPCQKSTWKQQIPLCQCTHRIHIPWPLFEARQNSLPKSAESPWKTNQSRQLLHSTASTARTIFKGHCGHPANSRRWLFGKWRVTWIKISNWEGGEMQEMNAPSELKLMSTQTR